MTSIRVVIVDDNPDFLEAAQALLATHPTVQVVGAVRSTWQALTLIETHKPDLVVMDMLLPSMEGIKATKLIRALPSPPDVVIATLYNTDEFKQLSLNAGAIAFIRKDRFVEQMLALVDARLKGTGSPPASV